MFIKLVHPKGGIPRIVNVNYIVRAKPMDNNTVTMLHYENGDYLVSHEPFDEFQRRLKKITEVVDTN